MKIPSPEGGVDRGGQYRSWNQGFAAGLDDGFCTVLRASNPFFSLHSQSCLYSQELPTSQHPRIVSDLRSRAYLHLLVFSTPTP